MTVKYGFVVSSAFIFRVDRLSERIEIGWVGKLGNSSVQYELAVFKAGEEEALCGGALCACVCGSRVETSRDDSGDVARGVAAVVV